jgi:RNA polymerase sigma factor (sigma-70 family)
VDAKKPPLTPDQLALVREGSHLVASCAEDIARRKRGLTRKEELLGPGTIALYEAAMAYEEDRHPSFLHYARYHVYGRMLDVVRADHFSLRARVEHAMERSFSRMMSHQELDVDMFRDSDEELREGAHRGCADMLGANFLAGLLGAEQVNPEQDVSEREEYVTCLALLREGIATLPAHERVVLELFYVKGMTLDEVAGETGTHANTAQRRHVAGLRRLRKFLADRGVTRAPRVNEVGMTEKKRPP